MRSAAARRPTTRAGSTPACAKPPRTAIGRGAASHNTGQFIAGIREAAGTLVAAQSGDEQQVAERVAAAATTLGKLTATMATRAMPKMTTAEVAAVVAERAPSPVSP